MHDIAVVVVNYRSEPHTVRCLDHLHHHLGLRPARTVVIDNSPEGGLAGAIRDHGLAVRYLSQPANLGFGAAVNLAAASSTQPILLLLNPDASPAAGCLEGLCTLLRGRPGLAAVGPRLVSPDPATPSHPSATRRDPDLVTTLVEHTVLRRFVRRDWLHRSYFVTPEEATTELVECAMVQGACLALRRRAFDEVGGFDAERFFLYWEETDLERRLRRAGWTVGYAPGLVCHHVGGASGAGDLASTEAHFWRGLFAYHRVYGGRGRELALRALLPLGMAAEVAMLGLLQMIRRGRDPALTRDLGTARGRLRQLVQRLGGTRRR